MSRPGLRERQYSRLCTQSSHNHPTLTQALHHLITVQTPRRTRSSSLVTVAHPSTPSALRITVHFFHLISETNSCLLFANLRFQSLRFLLTCSNDWHFLFYRLATLIIHHSLFHCRLKAFLFHKSFSPQPSFFFSTTDSTDSAVCIPILLTVYVIIFHLLLFTFF